MVCIGIYFSVADKLKFSWVRLDLDDEVFKKQCGSDSFDAPEEQVFERIKIAENKRKERKEAV